MRKKEKDFAVYRATIADKPCGLPVAMTALRYTANKWVNGITSLCSVKIRTLQSRKALTTRRKLTLAFRLTAARQREKERGEILHYFAKNNLVAGDFWTVCNVNLNFMSRLSLSLK